MTTMRNYNSWPNIISFFSINNKFNNASPNSAQSVPFTTIVANVSQLVYIILTNLLISMSSGQVKLALLFLIEKVHSYIQLHNNAPYIQHLDFIASELLVDLLPAQLSILNTQLSNPIQLIQVRNPNINYVLPVNNQEPNLNSDQDIQNFILQDLYSKIYPVNTITNIQLANIIVIIRELIENHGKAQAFYPTMLLNYRALGL